VTSARWTIFTTLYRACGSLSAIFADRPEKVCDDPCIDAVLLRFPEDESAREPLRSRGIPRLLLVSHGTPPPLCTDPLEDWIWASASDEDRAHRCAVLSRRAEHRAPTPAVDHDGLLHVRGRWASLSPIEAVLTSEFVAHFDRLVERSALAQAVWPTGPPRPRTLDTHILRLRRRVADFGLEIETVRSRGWVMHAERV